MGLCEYVCLQATESVGNTGNRNHVLFYCTNNFLQIWEMNRNRQENAVFVFTINLFFFLFTLQKPSDTLRVCLASPPKGPHYLAYFHSRQERKCLYGFHVLSSGCRCACVSIFDHVCQCFALNKYDHFNWISVVSLFSECTRTKRQGGYYTSMSNVLVWIHFSEASLRQIY